MKEGLKIGTFRHKLWFCINFVFGSYFFTCNLLFPFSAKLWSSYAKKGRIIFFLSPQYFRPREEIVYQIDFQVVIFWRSLPRGEEQVRIADDCQSFWPYRIQTPFQWWSHPHFIIWAWLWLQKVSMPDTGFHSFSLVRTQTPQQDHGPNKA